MLYDCLFLQKVWEGENVVHITLPLPFKLKVLKGGMKKMENELNGTEMDSWDGFLGSAFLGVEDVKSEQDVFVCIGLEMDKENGRPMLVLEKDNVKQKYSLNVTNSNFVKDAGMKSPKEVIGKKIYFRKSMAFSPNAKKDVPTLRIAKIE